MPTQRKRPKFIVHEGNDRIINLRIKTDECFVCADDRLCIGTDEDDNPESVTDFWICFSCVSKLHELTKEKAALEKIKE